MATAAMLDTPSREALAELLLTLADDEFVIGFWDSEWTGIAPMLEEDVATSSIAQDEIGHAKALYELIAELTDDDADRIAFGRPPEAFRHAALLNHRRGDWAQTVARRWLYEAADGVRLAALSRSTFEPLANLTAKIRREETYHQLHWDAWLHRLADGAPEGHDRLLAGLEALWTDAHAIFAPLGGEDELIAAGILPEPMEAMRGSWARRVQETLGTMNIPLPEVPAPTHDGRTRRTDDFAWLHGQFTLVSSSEEGAVW